jgi:hypothetical protein
MLVLEAPQLGLERVFFRVIADGSGMGISSEYLLSIDQLVLAVSLIRRVERQVIEALTQ